MHSWRMASRADCASLSARVRHSTDSALLSGSSTKAKGSASRRKPVFEEDAEALCLITRHLCSSAYWLQDEDATVATRLYGNGAASALSVPSRKRLRNAP